MDPLRSRVIRLAYQRPEFRLHLLPLLKTATTLGGNMPTATDALIAFVKSHGPVRDSFVERARDLLDYQVRRLYESNKPPVETPDWMRTKRRSKKPEPTPKVHVVTPITRDEVLRRFWEDVSDFPLSGLDTVNYAAYKDFLEGWIESICRGPSEWVSVSLAYLHLDDLSSKLEAHFRLLGDDYGDNPDGVEEPARTYEQEIYGFLRKSGAKVTYEHSGMRHERGWDTIGWVYEYRCEWVLDLARIVTDVVGPKLEALAQSAIDDPKNDPDR